MLAVASPPPSLHLDHDRPRSPVFSSPAPPSVFGPSNSVNGSLNSIDNLLKHPAEFKQGCLTPTSGVLTAGIAEGKYQPINDGPMSEDEDDDLIVEKPVVPASPSKQSPQTEKLFSESLDMNWPADISRRHPGFDNRGNTCFLNSVLQCLLHTPPLLNILFSHNHIKIKFCMICSLRDLTRASFLAGKRNTIMVLGNLNLIAKGMRQGRQEDAHEFLRYTVDTLQRSALMNYSSTSSIYPIPSKIPPSLAETSWVHAIFGGRLRSRIRCRTCQHCSDTFDSLLDLSVDIDMARVSSLSRALAQFVKPEVLSGEDAYRCERCKKPVTAEKSMTVHEAPVCLTIHLKRFTPTGRKNISPVSYPEILDLQPCMSEGQTSKKYVLYGVIHHFGSGPNSGHYTAHVKGADGRWTEMDDEVVTSCKGAPVNLKNAYVLFYMQTDQAHPTPTSVPTNGNDDGGARHLKRTRDDMETNPTTPGRKPNGIPSVRTTTWDAIFKAPASKKTRVENSAGAKEGVAGPSRPAPVGVASTLGKSLVTYDDDEIEDAGEVVKPSSTFKDAPSPTTSTNPNASSPAKSTTFSSPLKPTSTGTTPSRPTPIPQPTAAPTISSSIPTSSFYGLKKKEKEKDKRGTNPYGLLSGSGNLHAKKAKQETKQLENSMGFTTFGSAGVKNRMKGRKVS